jgi:hypothetical protein
VTSICHYDIKVDNFTIFNFEKTKLDRSSMKIAVFLALCMFLATSTAFVPIKPRINGNRVAHLAIQAGAKREPPVATKKVAQGTVKKVSLSSASKTKSVVVGDVVEKKGVEQKYLVALGVFFLAALWDKQFMHGGILPN